ncbi:MAG TPA: hypothetical protein VEK85_02960 [Gemmatimonadales bacterium]|nr:hypothetical protein [Gemmatimonadales bacterium]
MARLSIPRIHVAAFGGLAALLLTSSAATQGTNAAPARAAAVGSVCAAGAHGLDLSFASQFAGVSQDDHSSNVWNGQVSGPAGGALVVTLEPLGSLVETARPVWQVKTRWIVSSVAPGEGPLVAELYGTVNWKSGVLRLSGVVTDGCLRGYEAVASGRFANLDGEGTLQIRPAIALR